MHTPGPWKFQKGSIVSANGEKICVRGLALLMNGSAEEEQEADSNSCLIAASPKLLEALEKIMIEYSNNGEILKNTYVEAFAAIREAKGE